MARSLLGRSMFATARRHARAIVCVVGALTLVCALGAPATAAPGQIDTTFGHLGNGTVLADHGPVEFVSKVLRQTDGKIVSIASAFDANFIATVTVTRYLANGSIDASFGSGGTFTLVMHGTGSISDGVLQPDGKIVLAGWSNEPSSFLVMRLRTNGTIDPSFVTPPPATAHFPGTRSDRALSVALGTGGTIVLAGLADENTAIARYTSTGALDPTFSGDGLVTHDFGGASTANDVAVQPDGRIVVSGFKAPTAGDLRLLVARFKPDGTIDAAYGTGGSVATAGMPIHSAQALLLQGTKAVVAGIVDTATAALARYTANGTLDPTFGSGGTTRVHVNKLTLISGLVADASGRVVGVGDAAYSDDFPGVSTFTALFRFSANGAPDTTFGCFGTVLTEVLGNGAGKAYNASGAATAAAAGNDIVVGGDAVTFNTTDLPPTDDVVARYDGDGPHTSGYALLRGDGGTSAFGGAPACGSVVGLSLNAPIVGLAQTPGAPGNWTVASDGGVFSFGAARFHGSMGGTRLNQPIVGMAATPDGKGYWLVASDGGIFSFGTARFFGSTGNIRLNQPVVGMAAARDGKGYWLVARDGGVFSFGSARFAGSTGNIRLNQPVVGMAADPDGAGYWLVASDGGVFSFGAKFAGSTGAIRLNQPVVGMAADPDGTGYWMGARDGGLFAFAATFSGSTGATPFPAGSARSTIGIAATP